MTVQAYTPYQMQQAVNGARRRRQQGLSVMVHGWAKQGKSSLADTGPAPRLIIDVEGTSYWTPSRKIYWDPQRETVPFADGSWDSCIVIVHDHNTVFTLKQILDSGSHPFNSVSIDSVTEVQQRIIDTLVGTKKMDRDSWGALLRNVNSIVRGFRDLITHPVRPLWSVSFVAGTHWDQRAGKWRPLVQGQAQDYLPYYVDVLAWIEATQDGTRHLLIGPDPTHETGERVGGRLPYALQVGYPGRPGWTVESMLTQVLQG